MARVDDMTEPRPTSELAFELEEDPEQSSEEPALQSGAIIDGKYAIQRQLGRGGTGTVYEAVHVTVGHRVAVKIVNDDRAQRPETLARFEREAKICGTIRHPNIGQIYDVGTTDDGKPYMVLELHEGQSLADALDESLLPIPAILEIARQMLAGLTAVHHAGVVHRDIKPDNAMLVRTLEGDIVVKLVDFGISKVVRANIDERTLTREGSMLGSPDYMSPEQLRGQNVDLRTDIYSVGVLLYEGITGSTPFDADNLSDLMAAVLRDPVVPPRELRPDCSAELEALILKAMARDPDARFESAAEMARELELVRGSMRLSASASIAPPPRKILPRRADRATRARRMRQASAPPAVEPAATEPAATESAAVVPPQDAATTRPRARTFALAALVLLTLSALAALLLSRSGSPRTPEAVVVEVAPRANEPPARLTQPEPNDAPASLPLQAPSAVLDVRSDEPTAQQAATRAAKPKRGRSSPSSMEAGNPSVKDLMEQATSAFVLGQMPRARALYQEVLARSPAHAEAFRGLGLVSSRMGQRSDAMRAFERYLELRPNAPDAARIREQLEKLR
jgi:serine/threonine-protein kinase